MAGCWDLFGKTAFVTGGSGGLGKAISRELASRGAHITIFARSLAPLGEAVKEIREVRLDPSQEIGCVAIDLSDAAKVDEAFKSQRRVADVLYCVAGGNHAENGFFLEIKSEDIDRCMRNNYYSAAYAAKSMLDIWVTDDKTTTGDVCPPRHRRIVFINSAAAFCALPGSIAYTPAKCALRALADTLRMEVLRYCCDNSRYTIHSAFPADFVSPGFLLEQNTKTPLTKRIQGTDRSLPELIARFPSSEKVALLIIAAVDRGEYTICEDSLAASVLYTGMLGPSPKRGFGVFDSVMSVVVGWFVWPFLRWRWEAMTREDGKHSWTSSS